MTTPDPSTDRPTAPGRRDASWFRESAVFQALATSVLPALLQSRSEARHLVLWSAECSSGQDAYSLAIVLDERLPHGWTAEIIATDASQAMVDRVRAGRYSQVEMNRGLPANALVKYFSRVGTEWEVAPRLRAMVRAERLEVTGELTALPDFDVVLLPDTLSHLDETTRAEVADRVRDVVATDGYLLLGSAEHDLDLGDRWVHEPCGRTRAHRPAAAVVAALVTPATTAAPAQLPDTTALPAGA